MGGQVCCRVPLQVAIDQLKALRLWLHNAAAVRVNGRCASKWSPQKVLWRVAEHLLPDIAANGPRPYLACHRQRVHINFWWKT